MKWLTVLVAFALLVPVGLPAGSASPPAGRVARLERQVETLRSRVERLRSQVRALSRANASSLRSAHALARLAAGSSGCPVTAPNNSEPPGSTFGSVFHGNGSLWVGMWDANVVVWPPEPDGSVEAKFGWWRGVAGTLRIEGRRLDASAPPLVSRVPEGYGASGFQSTALLFPSPGCWEVTGRVGTARLTFVTLVVAA